jgi:hypothetical protein
LVEVHKAARFFFLSAFTIIVGVFAIGFFSRSPDEETKAVAQQLRSDPSFVAQIRGDRGEAGPKGDSGQKGDTGPKGERGEKGEKASVDENEFIELLLKDPGHQKRSDEKSR